MLEHVFAWLLVAACRDRRQQAEEHLRVELAPGRNRTHEKAARGRSALRGAQHFRCFPRRNGESSPARPRPVFGLGRFSERIDQLPSAFAERRKHKQLHHILLGQTHSDGFQNTFAIVVIRNRPQRASDDVLERVYGLPFRREPAGARAARDLQVQLPRAGPLAARTPTSHDALPRSASSSNPSETTLVADFAHRINAHFLDSLFALAEVDFFDVLDFVSGLFHPPVAEQPSMLIQNVARFERGVSSFARGRQIRRCFRVLLRAQWLHAATTSRRGFSRS